MQEIALITITAARARIFFTRRNLPVFGWFELLLLFHPPEHEREAPLAVVASHTKYTIMARVLLPVCLRKRFMHHISARSTWTLH